MRGTSAAPPTTGNFRRSNRPDGRGPEGSIRPRPAGCFTAALKTQFGVLDFNLDRLTFEELGADLAVLFGELGKLVGDHVLLGLSLRVFKGLLERGELCRVLAD